MPHPDAGDNAPSPAQPSPRASTARWFGVDVLDSPAPARPRHPHRRDDGDDRRAARRRQDQSARRLQLRGLAGARGDRRRRADRHPEAARGPERVQPGRAPASRTSGSSSPARTTCSPCYNLLAGGLLVRVPDEAHSPTRFNEGSSLAEMYSGTGRRAARWSAAARQAGRGGGPDDAVSSACGGSSASPAWARCSSAGTASSTSSATSRRSPRACCPPTSSRPARRSTR